MSKRKSLFQIRRKEPRAGARDPYYSPERDIAHIGPQMVAGAVRAVDCLPFPDSPHTPGNPEAVTRGLQEPWLDKFISDNGITYADLIKCEAPRLLARALNRIISAEHPPAAMTAVGFDKLPAAIQMLFYARLGQVFLSAVWAGVKDVSRPESDPPISFEEFLQDVEEAFRGFLGTGNDDEAGGSAAANNA